MTPTRITASRSPPSTPRGSPRRRRSRSSRRRSISRSRASRPGAPITYAGYPAGGRRRTGPAAAAGFLTTVVPPSGSPTTGASWVFDGWSDGGTISHDISIPAQDLVLTARYRDTGPAPFSGTSAGLAPGGDKLGPVIRLRSRRPARKLAGTVSDPAGVSSLRIAVRRGCRWWNARAGTAGTDGEVREAALDERRAETVQARDMGLEPEARRTPAPRQVHAAGPRTGPARQRLEDVRRQAPPARRALSHRQR